MIDAIVVIESEFRDSGFDGAPKTVAERVFFRERIEQIQAGMIEFIPEDLREDFIESCTLTHTFSNGLYVRQIFLPAGSFIIGKIHKKSHMNIISSGRCIVRTEKFGSVIYDATDKPITFESEKGPKRVLWVEEDTYWTTLHVTECTNVANVEKEIFEIFYSDFVLDNPEFSLSLIEDKVA